MANGPSWAEHVLQLCTTVFLPTGPNGANALANVAVVCSLELVPCCTSHLPTAVHAGPRSSGATAMQEVARATDGSHLLGAAVSWIPATGNASDLVQSTAKAPTAAGSMVAAVPSVAVCRRTQGCSAAAARASQWGDQQIQRNRCSMAPRKLKKAHQAAVQSSVLQCSRLTGSCSSRELQSEDRPATQSSSVGHDEYGSSAEFYLLGT